MSKMSKMNSYNQHIKEMKIDYNTVVVLHNYEPIERKVWIIFQRFKRLDFS